MKSVAFQINIDYHCYKKKFIDYNDFQYIENLK